MALTDEEKTGLKQRLDELRARNKAARQAKPDRRARMRFLRGVYAAGRKFAASAHAGSFAKALGGDRGDVTPETFITLLAKAASRDDRRLVSRHVSALKYALSQNVRPRELGEWLARHGGLSGCARRWSRLQKRRAA